MQYGALVRETIDMPTAVNEPTIEALVRIAVPTMSDRGLDLQYTRPVWEHESYVEGDGSLYSETCSQWVAVYRYYPQTEPERSEAMAELMSKVKYE